MKAILERPDVAAQLAAGGAEPAPQPPEEFAAFTRAERAKWKDGGAEVGNAHRMRQAEDRLTRRGVACKRRS